MTDDETAKFKLELIELLAERSMSLFERRRRRLKAARARLQEARVSFADTLQRNRKGGRLTRDEYVVSHLGFVPGEREKLEATAEKERSVEN